jgi:hypothetical protein
MFDEREYLRDIAHRISEIAGRPEQSEKTAVIRSCNNLKPARPVVFARPENGWPDLHEKWDAIAVRTNGTSRLKIIS